MRLPGPGGTVELIINDRGPYVENRIIDLSVAAATKLDLKEDGVGEMDLQRLFVSRGGIDTTDAVDTRFSKGRYVQRRDILTNEEYIQEGIELAFHPFIFSHNWPGNP